MATPVRLAPPFEVEKLDALLERAGIDLVVATSRHNVRYLAGSYSFFFERMDAVGIDRYLPAVGYRPGRLEDAFFVGSDVDSHLHEADPPWLPTVIDSAGTTLETAQAVADRIAALSLENATIGVEQAFLPATSRDELARALPHATLVEASLALEELRAVKTERELGLLRAAAE